jgi:inosose dehydratase
MHVTLGSAPDSWGVWFPDDPLQTPWNRFMDELAEAGYRWTELGPYGYFPTDPEHLRKELDARGIGISAGIVIGALHTENAVPDLQPHFDDVCELTAAMDGKFLVLIGDSYRDGKTGELLMPAELTENEWSRLIDSVQVLGRQARERFGIELVFHHHADTHVEFPEQVERFLAETDPAQVSLCFDLGHFEYRGGDSVAFMREHHDRIPYLHLKSVDPAKRNEVMRTNMPFGEAVAWGMFVEPSEGSVDFPGFVDVLKEVDYDGWGIVEQDMYPVDSFDTPLPIAKRSREYLVSLGMGT